LSQERLRTTVTLLPFGKLSNLSQFTEREVVRYIGFYSLLSLSALLSNEYTKSYSKTEGGLSTLCKKYNLLPIKREIKLRKMIQFTSTTSRNACKLSLRMTIPATVQPVEVRVPVRTVQLSLSQTRVGESRRFGRYCTRYGTSTSSYRYNTPTL
jgi:hypothetical protein